MCDVCLVHVLDQRQAARHGAGCVDDAHPIGARVRRKAAFDCCRCGRSGIREQASG